MGDDLQEASKWLAEVFKTNDWQWARDGTLRVPDAAEIYAVMDSLVDRVWGMESGDSIGTGRFVATRTEDGVELTLLVAYVL